MMVKGDTMSEHPLVSVVIPAYNVENYITNTLYTVLNQSFQDFEVIVINDGSTDSTLSRVEDLRKNNSKIKIYTQKNKGQAAARNVGIKFSKGKFITFVDGDDLLKESYLEIMVRLMNETDVDIVALPYMNSSVTSEHDLSVKKGGGTPILFNSEEYLLRVLRCNGNLHNVSYFSKLYRSELFKRFRIPENHYYEDLAGFPLLLKWTHKVAWLDNKQYIYLSDRPSSTVNQITPDKGKDIIWALEYLVDHLTNDGKKVEKALQIIIVNNIYVAYIPLRNQVDSLRRIDKLIRRLSILYLFVEMPLVHISKKALLLCIWRKLLKKV